MGDAPAPDSPPRSRSPAAGRRPRASDEGGPEVEPSPAQRRVRARAASPVAVPKLSLRFGVADSVGRRPYQEDRHAIINPLLLPGERLPTADLTYAAVFDGHSGAAAADAAAARLHLLLATELATGAGTDISTGAGVASAFDAAFAALDLEILAAARAASSRAGAAAVAALFSGARLHTAHAGDARAVLGRSGGVASRLTEDHKPGAPRERARVLAAGGRVEFSGCWRVITGWSPCGTRPPAGLAVSRSLGDLDFKAPSPLVSATPDVAATALAPGDGPLILASDGLWDVVSDQGAVDAALECLRGAKADGGGGDSAALAAAALVRAAGAAGSADNVCVVVVDLVWG